MTDKTTIIKLEKALAEFSDKVILKTILETLSADDVKKFLDLLLAGKTQAAKKLVTEKIPDLDDKVSRASQARLTKILKPIKT